MLAEYLTSWRRIGCSFGRLSKLEAGDDQTVGVEGGRFNGEFRFASICGIPVMMGVLVILGVLGVGLRIATDLVIAHIDPRQRQARI